MNAWILLPFIILLTIEVSGVANQLERFNSTMKYEIAPALNRIAERIGDLDHD